MTTEQRTGLLLGKDQVASSVAAIKSAREESLRKKREEEEAARTENILLRQAGELNALVDNGIQDVFVGAAQSLRDEYPDVKVRATKPTGKSSDTMAIVLEYDHKRNGSVESFRRIFAFPRRYSNDLKNDEFGISIGPLGAPEVNVMSSRSEEQSYAESYLNYSDPQVLIRTAMLVGNAALRNEGRQVVRVHNPRSLLEKVHVPRDVNDLAERQFIDVELPAVTVFEQGQTS